jgi:nucleoside-diphosphate-sugar epimerase
MKILFIGGTGNISTDCAALLHEQGDEITVLTRGQSPVPSEYEALTADREDIASMQSALAGRFFDVAIDFIAYGVDALETDLEVLGGKINQFIFISTAMVYAKPHTQVPITEKAPIGNKYSEYAQRKQECEEWLSNHADELPSTIVRPSHTYSKRWVPNTVSSRGYTIAARLEAGKPLFVPDDGQNLWTLTATTDFALGLEGLIGNENTIGEAFHITSDEALTWNEIYAEVVSAVGVSNPEIIQIPVDFICDNFPDQINGLRGDKANPGVFDNTKLKNFVPGFECKKPFREGVSEAVSYLREHPEEKHINSDVDKTIDDIISAWRQAS